MAEVLRSLPLREESYGQMGEYSAVHQVSETRLTRLRRSWAGSRLCGFQRVLR